MRFLVLACAGVMLLATASFGAEAKVSKATLDEMGLAGMRQLADEDGLAVRGKGSFAGVWGGSTASWPGGQSSSNNYSAGSSWLGKGSAAGGNSFSFGGRVQFQGFGNF